MSRFFLNEDTINGELGIVLSEEEAVYLYINSFGYKNKEEAMEAFLKTDFSELEDEIIVDGEKYLITEPVYGNLPGLPTVAGFTATGSKNDNSTNTYTIEWELDKDDKDFESLTWDKPTSIERN